MDNTEIIVKVLQHTLPNFPSEEYREYFDFATKFVQTSRQSYKLREKIFCLIFGWSIKQCKFILGTSSGKNIFLTGSAGTGKSYIISVYKFLMEQRINIAVTATTGLASILIGGCTIHSFAGIGVFKSSDKSMVKYICKSGELIERLNFHDVLIIDEVSMFGKLQFELLDIVLKRCRQNDKPFGGIQLILCGDFLQLPPINDSFVFQSPSWDSANIKIVHLDQPFRQKDTKWFQILQKIRMGKCDENVQKYIEENTLREAPTDSMKIWSKNNRVDDFNAEQLAKIPAQQYTYHSKVVKCLKNYEKGPKSVTLNEKKKYEKFFRFQYELKLKVGCSVILLVNRLHYGLYNGSRGVVTYCSDLYVEVVFEGLTHPIILRPDTETYRDPKSYPYVFTNTQIPLRLGYAMTMHKCQGTTLSSVTTSLSRNEIFSDGQAYTVLSRISNPKNCYLEKFDVKSIKANLKCIKFYENIK